MDDRRAERPRVLIIDGLNTFLRSYAVVPSMDTNGESVGGIVGFLRSLKSCIRDIRPSRTIVVWDGQGGSQKRRGIYAEYKAGRKPRLNRQYDFGETPDESYQNLRSQYGRLRDLVDLLGVTQVEVEAVEADDVIGFLCRHVYDGIQKVVVSTDRDFLQLVDRTTIVYSPIKKIYWTSKEMRESMGILPENYIYAKCLMGDGSDNIKGIRGIGLKTVLKLFPFLGERPSSMEEVLEHARGRAEKSPKCKSILEGRELLMANLQLMQLTTPIISPQSVRAIRHTIGIKKIPALTDFKLAMVQGGIQLEDADFFITFREQQFRAERTGDREENADRNID